MRVAGIVPAAGASRRMGANKLLLTVNGEPMIRRACQRALKAGLDPVIVVVNAQGAPVREALRGLNCEYATVTAGNGVMSASLHAGLAAVPDDAAAAMIILPDMIHVTVQMLAQMRTRAADSDAPLAVSSYEGTLAPPMLFRRGLFAELLAVAGDGAGRTVVTRHLDAACVLGWPAQLLADIDTPDDYVRASSGKT